LATTGNITVGDVHDLSAVSSAINPSAPSVAITQTHLLVAVDSSLAVQATTAAISQTHSLAAQNSQIIPIATTGAVYNAALINLDPQLLKIYSSTKRFTIA